jgi:hypothetical protein
MLLPVRDLLILIVAGVLFALIHATVRSSREQNVRFASYHDYLFRGRQAIHSLSGNLGGVFSLTGFVGATWVYALVFGGWIVVITLTVFIAVIGVTTAIVKRADAELPHATGNLLLDYLKARLTPRDFQMLTTIYALVYFALLVEELAAARLLLREMVRDPVVMSFLLILAVFTIFTYVYLGGFRAVVTADKIQILVLLAFSAVLAITILYEMRGGLLNSFRFPALDFERSTSLAGAAVFGFAWFAPAVDFYARLNYERRRDDNRSSDFVRLSYILVFALLMLGALFGTVMSDRIQVDATNSYPAAMVEFFLARAPLVALLFIFAIFSMFFTTLDTMIITALQIGYYERRRVFRRETLPTIILVATFISTQIDFAGASVLGVFTGSVLVLPTLAILRCSWPRVFKWLPENTSYLVFAGVVSVLVLGLFYERISTNFHSHFLLSLLTLGSAVVSGIAMTLFSKRKEHSYEPE